MSMHFFDAEGNEVGCNDESIIVFMADITHLRRRIYQWYVERKSLSGGRELLGSGYTGHPGKAMRLIKEKIAKFIGKEM